MYSPPQISGSGLSIPSYQDIIDFFTDGFRTIFGSNVYLGNDSADFQLMSLVALVASDTNQALQQDYLSRAPNYATGAALDSVVSINGITRKSASNSTCLVILSGSAFAEIDNGIVQDVNGDQWSLPPSVILSAGGTATVTATCLTPGAINALASQITVIVTPTAGWASVTNGSNVASVGQPVESDSQLRTRQAQSTSLPSQTLLAGTQAALEALPGVTRVNVVENQTNVVDSNGNPPHSVTAVVDGGNPSDIAMAIYTNKGIGCFTNGTTHVSVTDPVTGFIESIGFINPPNYVPIYVAIQIHLLPGGTPALQGQIQAAVVNYLNSLKIGEIVTIGGLYATIMSVTPDITAPLFTVRQMFDGNAPGPGAPTDVPMSFSQVSQGVTGNVTVTLV